MMVGGAQEQLMPLILLQMGTEAGCCGKHGVHPCPCKEAASWRILTSLLASRCALTSTRAHGRRKFADLEVKKIVGEGHKSSVAWAQDRHSGLDVAIKMYHTDKMSILNCRQASRQTWDQFVQVPL